MLGRVTVERDALGATGINTRRQLLAVSEFESDTQGAHPRVDVHVGFSLEIIKPQRISS
jgi:hypothetical protein